jgi:protoheme IX farnesyltransferase
MMAIITTANHLKESYWPLIKSRQTFMLTLTGVTGYLCQPALHHDWFRLISLIASLFITISGCTVLNMYFDRDIDRKMVRTSTRPLATARINSDIVGVMGIVLVASGLLCAVTLSWLYFFVVLTGAVVNVLVYTIWLKRRIAWSILWGGIAGGMPILAGHVAATGRIDLLGLILAVIIICWIPCHNLTLGTLYSDDYLQADIPIFTNVYGLAVTRTTILISSLLTTLFIMIASAMLAASAVLIVILALLGIGLMVLVIYGWIKTSRRSFMIQYKCSSIYLLASMILLTLNGLI